MKRFSILIPTRGRPKRFEQCIDSLFTLASDPKRVEVIYRVDEDDPMINRYAESPRVRRIVGNRFAGYPSNWQYIEECARASFGNYMMQMVDTAVMVTKDWDKIYEDTIMGNPIAVVASHVHDETGNPQYPWSFPLITRKIYEITGMFCLGQNPSVDRCWQAFAYQANCGILAPVHIKHTELRLGGFMDLTAKESLPFYDELNANLADRMAEIKDIGIRYAQIVEVETGI